MSIKEGSPRYKADLRTSSAACATKLWSSSRWIAASNRNIKRAGFLVGSIGGVFLAAGLLLRIRGPGAFLLIGIGAVFSIFGLAAYRKSSQFPEPAPLEKTSEQDDRDSGRRDGR